MEIVFEFLYMLLLDGCFEIISSEKINIVIRRIVLSIVTIFYGALIVGFAILAVKVSEFAIKMLLIAIAILMLALLIKLWFKVFKTKAN